MKYLPKILSSILLGGVLFAFFTLLEEFRYFYQLEGTIFKLKDCAITNPFLTPCFFGAVAFWIAFTWSLIILAKKTVAEKVMQQLRLNILLLAGTIFAWGNFAFTVYKYLQEREDFGCSAIPIEHPFQSSCFVGALIYSLALVVGYFCWKQYLKYTQT